MTNEEIKNHFDGKRVYQFDGNKNDLHELMLSLNCSYNTLIVKDIVYFVADMDIVNDKVIILV